MGKKLKKMKKNIRKTEGKANAAVMSAAQMEKIAALKGKVYENKEAGNYEEALLAVIELFEMNCVEVELLYETADLYYLSGDYERAAVWGEKTLSFDPNYMRALLLLANVYAIEDKVKKGLGTLQRILEVSAGALTEEAKESIDEILDYFDSDYDVETLEEKYPLVWAYLQRGGEAEETESVGEAFTDAEEIAPEAAAEEDDEADASEEAAEEACTEADWQEAEVVADAPQEAEMEAAAAEAVEETPEADVSAPAEEAVVVADSVFSAEEAAELMALSPEEMTAFIMGKEISLTEKVGLCNYFAAFYDVRKRPAHVVALLQQALRIDATDDLSLKNLGYALLAQGDREGALRCFGSLRRKDLMVLAQIRSMQH